MQQKVETYRDFTDDFVQTKKQEVTLPEGFTWLHESRLYHLGAALLYALAVVASFFYTRLYFHVRVENRAVLKEAKTTGCFLYGNHTQPAGDAFAPVRYTFPKRIYTVIDPSNLGIPVIGKILPMVGGLVIPDSFDDMKKFLAALRYHVEKKRCIVIYPEAHVWPWCSFIRPFPDTAFRYPVMLHVPAYCMTTTYQEPRRFGKPRMTVYLDGPFYPDQTLGAKQAQKKLHDEIAECMEKRSRNSTYDYVKYIREPDE